MVTPDGAVRADCELEVAVVGLKGKLVDIMKSLKTCNVMVRTSVMGVPIWWLNTRRSQNTRSLLRCPIPRCCFLLLRDQ